MPLLAQITQERLRELEFAGAPDGWLRLLGLGLVVGVLWLVFWLYRCEGRAGAGLRLRIGLAAVRSVVILLLVVVWLNPVLATYWVRTLTARVIVLVDDSASMGIRDAAPDGPGPPGASPQSRLQSVQALLSADDYRWLRRLADRNELALYRFGDETRALPIPWEPPVNGADAMEAATPARSEPGDVSPPSGAATRSRTLAALDALDPRTDPGSAIARALQDGGEQPVAGIVVLSDGAFNSGLSAESVTAYARRYDAAIHTVAVGAPVEPPNLRVTQFSAPTTAARGDPVELKISVGASGVEERTARVRILARPAGDQEDAGAEGGTVALATREVQIGGGRPEADINITVSADQAGEFIYVAQVEGLPDEAVESDNRREAFVRVLDEKIRVLLVAGRPSYEYRYVSRLLERDRSVNLSCWLQSAEPGAIRDGDTVITGLPRKTEELLEYDAILLFDPLPAELDSAWAIKVRALVDEFGGGLLLQAGSHFTGQLLRDSRLTEMTNILPIVPDPDAEVRLSEQGSFRTRAYPMNVPEESWPHPLLRLEDDLQTNRSVWRALPGVWWHMPVQRAKPLATVLLRYGGPYHAADPGSTALFAVQPVGAGRTAYLGFDGTWRWRTRAEPYFNRFWVRLVRYLAQARRQGSSKRGRIVLDREQIEPGDFVKIEARVLDERFVPWHAGSIEATVARADGSERRLSLQAIAGREGWFEGRLPIDWSGPGTIHVPLPTTDQTPTSAAATSGETELVRRLYVAPSDVEMRSLRLNVDALMRLSEETGGRYTKLESAGQLPDWIESATRQIKPRGDDRPLWDDGWTLGLLAALLGVEWAVRRRNHLL